ncbi:Ribonuclease h2 subunit b [Thalictrum thalictroides]|uniref:Ribonuclease H2 subunit B n=1 Tax=Thalictrum thalictroides TaxID=46969 RepID=A0A7J6UX21_THATH|nr:Ribonuclease h2 subunit b [Thalictrum thalictroides]
MAWYEGVEEARLLIAPVSETTITTTNGIGEGSLLSLRHPKSGNPTCYFLNNGSLQELNWFKQSYGSWFLGEYVCEDGGLYTASPVDPVFILLPVFQEARMQKKGEQGKFRPLDEIMFINGYPGYHHLLSIAEESMQVVCEIKEIGSSKFFRLHDSKVLAWLCHKVHQLKTTLPTLDKNYAAQDEKEMLVEVVSLLGEYLRDEPWLKLLCGHLKLDLQEATKRMAIQEFLPSALGDTPGSSNSLQAKNASQKKTSGKQAKKMKTETDSQNIKDMFTRASRRKS